MSSTGQPEVPYDNVSEVALLGAALLDYQVFLAFDVVPNDFLLVAHRALWAAGQKLAEQSIQADEITLAGDVLVSVGGPTKLLELVRSCPSAARASSYARCVREVSSQRQTLAIAGQIAQAAYKDQDERQSRLKSIIQKFSNLGTDTITAWKVYVLQDAFEPRPPLVYVVEDLFSLPSLSIVYGAPGCLKSMLMADMALCVAGDIPWLPALPGQVGVLPRDVVTVPVLWIDFDNGTRRTHERIEALARAHGLDPDVTPFSYVSMPTPWLDANDDISMDKLIRMVNAMNVGLVVVDNLGVVSGDADENTAQMVQVLANFRLLSERTGTAVVVIHHQRKSTGYNARTGETLRGHSSIEAALDLALLVQREDGARDVKIQSTKTRGTDVLPFGATFTFKHRLGTKELESAQFCGLPMVDNRKPAQAQRAILEVIENAEKPPNKMTLARTAQEITDNIGLNYLRDTIDIMVSNDKIVMTPGPNQSQTYQLGDE